MEMRILRPIIAFVTLFLFGLPASALDLNSFRAEHKLPPLTYSGVLAGAAYRTRTIPSRRQTLDP